MSFDLDDSDIPVDTMASGPVITIGCAHSETEPAGRSIIARFTWVDPSSLPPFGEEGGWTRLCYQSKDERRYLDAKFARFVARRGYGPLDEVGVQIIEGSSEWITEADFSPPFPNGVEGQPITDPDGRGRYRFKCRLCGRTVPARKSKLAPIFDTLAVNGIEWIDLASLAARL